MASSSLIYDVLAEQTTEYERLALRSSYDRYHEFKAANPRLLERHGITDDNYIRKPNGTGEYLGMWTPPYTELDVWDYHVNRDWSVPGRIAILEEGDPRYIMPPTQGNPTYVDVTTGLYPRRLLRLWDFMYNQEYFLNPETARRTRRNREFPTRRSEMLPIIPPYLPDATMPELLQLRYPYAAWESAVYTTSDRRRQAQRYNYIAAHSSSGSGINAYALEPRDITLSLNPLVRPIYRQDEVLGAFFEGYSPLDYGPVVLRDVEARTKSGWLSLFRQRLRTRATQHTLPKAPRILDWYNAARSLIQQEPTLPLIEVVLRVLPEQATLLWPDPTTRPTTELYRPPRRDKATSTYRSLNEKESEAYNTLSYLLNLLRSLESTNEGLPYELDVNRSFDVPSAVFYDEPYKVLTIQVHPSTRDLFGFSTSFTDVRTWIASVPPVLSAVEPRTLDDDATNSTTNWYANDEAGGALSLAPIGDSKHQVRVDIQYPGEFTIYCDTQWGRFTYELASVLLVVKRVTYKIQDGDRLWQLNESRRTNRRLWSGIRFSSEHLANLRNLSDEWIQGYLATHWTSTMLDPKNLSVVKKVNAVTQLDYLRPLLLVHAQNDRSSWQFVVFELDYLYKYIQTFGETVQLQVDLPESVRSTLSVVWKTDDDGDSTSLNEELAVVVPQQLRWYRAEIYAPMHVFSIYLLLDILWVYPITRRYMIRNDMPLQYNEERGWPLITSAPRDLPLHTDPDLRYAVTRPQSDVETLSAPFTGEFFKSLIYCYASNYHVDLQNYARLYPHVQEYSLHMQHIVDANKGRVGIARTLPNDLLALLPRRMNLPLLFIRLTNRDEDDSRVRLAYVVYDPLRMYWLNIYSRKTPILRSWNVEIPEERRQRINWLYKRISVAPRKHREPEELPRTTLHLQELEQRLYLADVGRRSEEHLIDVRKLHRRNQQVLVQQKSLITDYLGANIRQYDFLEQVRELFNYFNYICVVCEELYRTMSARPIVRNEVFDAFSTHISTRMNEDRAHVSLIRDIALLRSGAFMQSLTDNRPVYNFTRKILELPASNYDYTMNSAFALITTAISIKE